MDLLLDTHTFIWFINGEVLSSQIINSIEDRNNKCFISIASLWEIAIKSSLNKLSLKSDFDKIADFLDANNIEILAVSFEHLQNLNKLDFHHRDPFDRIIIAQGIAEKLVIITRDEQFSNYTDQILWN